MLATFFGKQFVLCLESLSVLYFLSHFFFFHKSIIMVYTSGYCVPSLAEWNNRESYVDTQYFGRDVLWKQTTCLQALGPRLGFQDTQLPSLVLNHRRYSLWSCHQHGLSKFWFPRGNSGLGSCEPLVTNFLPTHQHIILFYEFLCAPDWIYTVDLWTLTSGLAAM